MKRGRWATGAAVVLIAFSVVSCSGTAAQDADPRKAVTGYLDALSRGDISRAAAFTSDPVGAAWELTKVRADLDPSGAAFALEQLSDGSSAQARFSYRSTWQFGPNRQWSYSAEGELRSQNGGWRIAWDPSVIHPRLHEGQSIGFTEVSPASSRVTDRQGQPLLAPQVVTVVNVLPSKVSDRVALAGGKPPLRRSPRLVGSCVRLPRRFPDDRRRPRSASAGRWGVRSARGHGLRHG